MSDSLRPHELSIPGFPVHCLPKFAQTHVHWVSNATKHLIFCHLLLLLPSILSQSFSNEPALPIRWPKYWSFWFTISPSNEYTGLISFRIDWFDLLSIQGTLRSFLQHHSSEASILWCSAFFMAQLSHPYMTTGKTIAFTIWTVVCQVLSLLFNMLSRFVIAFLLKSKTRSSNLPIVGIKKLRCSKSESFEQIDPNRKLQIWDSEPGSLTL